MNHAPLFLPVSYDDIQHVAVCIARTSPRTVHAGLAYRTIAEELMFLDINLEGKVTAAPISYPDRLCWAVPQLHEMVLKQVRGYCDKIGKATPQLTYAFGFYPDSELVAVGDTFEVSGQGFGFTCATFVLAVFQAIKKPLLKLSPWPMRTEDTQHQQWLCEIMARSEAASGRAYGLTKVQAELPCLRYRPEEVLGACRAGKPPIAFDDASRAGAESIAGLDLTINALKEIGRPHRWRM